jgi:hypothetical protein
MYSIEKPKRQFDVNAFLWGMFLLYVSRPGKQQPEPDGSYFIGDVAEARLQDQRLGRETPYSICSGLRQ